MLESRPSVTAERVALRRAPHQVLDVPPVFQDPLALRIAGVAEIGIARDAGESAGVNRQRRAYIAARSRYVEDELAPLVGRASASVSCSAPASRRSRTAIRIRAHITRAC